MKPPITPQESLERRERAIRIERAMQKSGYDFESLAAHLAMSVEALRNIVCSSQDFTKARQRVTNVLGEIFWPGVLPVAQPADFGIVDSMLSRAAALVAGVDTSAGSENSETNRAIADKLNALVPEIRAAVVALTVRLGHRIPISTLTRIVTVLPQHLSDRVLGINRDPKNPNRILVGTVHQKPAK